MKNTSIVHICGDVFTSTLQKTSERSPPTRSSLQLLADTHESTICYLHLAPQVRGRAPTREDCELSARLAEGKKKKKRAVPACTSPYGLWTCALCRQLAVCHRPRQCLTVWPFCLKTTVRVQTDKEALPAHTEQCRVFTEVVFCEEKTLKGLCGEHTISFALKCFQHLKSNNQYSNSLMLYCTFTSRTTDDSNVSVSLYRFPNI